ncbi:MAG: NUDIX domain-containing protein [Patescibacteria group bacterium]
MEIKKAQSEKVVVYCVHDGRLLVFRHVDFSFEEVGIQVPAGSIRENESPKDTALRELQEETGLDAFEIIGDLGIATYDMAPYRNEVQNRHFFLARITDTLPDRWKSVEEHDGKQSPTNLECFWIPLKSAHILQAGQGALLYTLNESVL